MKIKIIREVPVNEKYKPKIGEVYEAVELERKRERGPKLTYEIEVNGEKVKLYDCEAEELRFSLDTDNICYGCKYYDDEWECNPPELCIEGSMNGYRMEG